MSDTYRPGDIAMVRSAHVFCAHSSSRNGMITRKAGCSCGARFDWIGREAQHDEHVDAMVVEHFKTRVERAKREGRREALAEASGRLTSKRDQVYGGAPSNSYLDGQHEAYEAAVDIVTGLLAEHPQEAP